MAMPPRYSETASGRFPPSQGVEFSIPTETSDLSAPLDPSLEKRLLRMDAISAIASIAGVFAIASSVIQSGDSFYSSVQKFHNEFRQFTEEVERLFSLFNSLRPIVKRLEATMPEESSIEIALLSTSSGYQNSAPDRSKIRSPFIQQMTDELISCLYVLEAIQTILWKSSPTAGQPVRTLVRRLKWHLNKRTLQTLFVNLERRKSTFSVVMSAFERERMELEVQAEKRLNLAKMEGNQITLTLKSILPYGFQSKHESLRRERTPNTGAWIFKDPRFQLWVTGKTNARVLLCKGPEGSGKTMLISTIIDRLEHEFGKDCAIIYAYFDYQTHATNKITKVFGCIMKQIIERFDHNSLPDELKRDLSELRDNIRSYQVHLKDYIQIITRSTRYFSKVFLLFDALDEYGSRGARQEFFRSIAEIQNNCANTHVLFTSRPHISLDGASISSESIEILANADDLELVIREKLDNCHHVSINLKEHIIMQLIKRANETYEKLSLQAPDFTRFLMIPFLLNHICGEVTEKGVKHALRNLPVGLDDSLKDTLTRMQLKGKVTYMLALKTLAWVFYATRPLQVEELREALSIEEWSRERDFDDCISEDVMLECCMGFIMIRSTDNTVHFSHSSVQHFLESRRELLPSNLYLANCCLTYLMYDGVLSIASDPDSAVSAYPLLRYAADNWAWHGRENGERDVDFLDHMNQLLENPNLFRLMVRLRYQTAIHEPSLSESTSISTPLHIVAEAGFALEVDKLLKYGSDLVKAVNIYGCTPLHECSKGGCAQVVARLLQDSQCDVNARDKEGMTALHHAAEGGRTNVIRTLLDSNAASTAKDKYGRTALNIALSNHEKEAARLLFHDMIRVHAADALHQNSTPNKQTLLHQIANIGYVEGVTLLLEMGADPHVEDNWGYAPIHVAARKGHTDVVELLLNAMGHIVRPSLCGHTPLQIASKHGHDSTVDILLSKRPEDLYVRDFIGFTPLHSAAAAGQLQIVKKLMSTLKFAIPGEANTPSLFQLAWWGGHREVINFLNSHYSGSPVEPGSPMTEVEYSVEAFSEIEKAAVQFRPRADFPYQLTGLCYMTEDYGLMHLKNGQPKLASAWYDIALLMHPLNRNVTNPKHVVNPRKACDHCNVKPITGPCFTCTQCIGPCFDLCSSCYNRRFHIHAHKSFIVTPAFLYPLPTFEDQLKILENVMRETWRETRRI